MLLLLLFIRRMRSNFEKFKILIILITGRNIFHISHISECSNLLPDLLDLLNEDRLLLCRETFEVHFSHLQYTGQVQYSFSPIQLEITLNLVSNICIKLENGNGYCPSNEILPLITSIVAISLSNYAIAYLRNFMQSSIQAWCLLILRSKGQKHFSC